MGKIICMTCISLFLLIPPIIILSLSLITHHPKLYIQDFYIPSLNINSTTQLSKLNTFIFIHLKLVNVMPFNGLRYGDLNLTFFYGLNGTLTVANHTVAGFYQGLRKTAHKIAVVRTRGMPWEDAFEAVSGGSTVDFAVELATTVKLRRCGFYTKRKTVVVAADVRVDASGEDVHHKVIKLR